VAQITIITIDELPPELHPALAQIQANSTEPPLLVRIADEFFAYTATIEYSLNAKTDT
jgi:hypothetical protein